MVQAFKPNDTRPRAAKRSGVSRRTCATRSCLQPRSSGCINAMGAEDTVATIDHVATAAPGGSHTAVEMGGRKS